MCRMFGMVANRAASPRELLHDAPRSLRALSQEHRDGWGIAVAAAAGNDWQVHRDTRCAAGCADYDALAGIEAQMVIAHVRKKTVGELALANTHPFRHGNAVFAHNGTIGPIASLVAKTSAEQLASIEGDTDSERLFAFVLTHIDAAAGDAERGVILAVRALQALGEIGSANFLLAAGSRLYAYRQGRSLYTLAKPGVYVVASERLTDDEGWLEVAERGLVILDHSPQACLVLNVCDPSVARISP